MGVGLGRLLSSIFFLLFLYSYTVNVQMLHFSPVAVGAYTSFSDGSGVVYHPFSGELLALPEDAALLIDCLSSGSLSEGELLSCFISAYGDDSLSAVEKRFEELLSSLIEEHGLVSVSAT